MKKYLWEQKNWFEFQYDPRALLKPLADARRAQGNLLGKTAALGIELKTEAQAEILVEEAIRTAEIEGMALNRDAVRSSVAVCLGMPPGVGIKCDRNADGLVDVLVDAIRFHDKPLTMERIHGWQAALFPTGYSGFHKIRVGAVRGDEPMQVVSGPVGRPTVHFEAPPIKQMERELRLFVDWWNRSCGTMDGILRAAAAHLRFITIHPYEDGNGRITRALTDMALAQDEISRMRMYSLSSHIVKTRKEYYAILEGVQTCRIDVTEWFLWFLRSFVAAIENSQGKIAHVFAKATFWQKYAQTSFNGRQKKVIQKLVEAGPQGFEGGLTTRKYVGMTKTSKMTAYREITDLLEKGILRRADGSKGRSVRYELVPATVPGTSLL
jgi:Fic family protein